MIRSFSSITEPSQFQILKILFVCVWVCGYICVYVCGNLWAYYFQKRLQIACRLDMPCSITELSVHSAYGQVRADGLDMALHVYFANPKVHAAVLWGFADQFGNFANDYFLTKGTYFTVSMNSIISVCLYVCMCVRVGVCMYISAYIFLHTYIYIYISF